MGKIKPQSKIRQPYYIGVVATMSSGKSTLLNALIGEELLHTANEATTAKITTLFCDNQSKSLYGSAKLRNGDIIKSTQLTKHQLHDWNADQEVSTIHLHLPLHQLRATKKHYPVLFDTPGPNNSQDDTHSKLTYTFIQQSPLDLLIYILNATQLGICDDKYFLDTIQSIRKNQSNPVPILFVLNKVDQLDPEKGETLDKILQNCEKYLTNLGFIKPEILPVSAIKALLALKSLKQQPLSRSERILIKHYLHDYVPKNEIIGDLKASKFAKKLLRDSNVPALIQCIQGKIHLKSVHDLQTSTLTKKMLRDSNIPTLTECIQGKIDLKSAHDLQVSELARKVLRESNIPALTQCIPNKIDLKSVHKENTIMATSLQIKHNPFLVETEITINGQEPAENSILGQYRKQRLQLWIDNLFDDLYNIFNGETQYEVTFHGVPSDCNDMELAVANANAQGFHVRLNCTQAEDGDMRLSKIQKIMHSMENDELFGKYIADNLDVREKFKTACNRDFDVYVVATMSSGKSTLINSLMGCGMLPALNEATTATIAKIIDNDQMQQGHFTAKCLNKQGDVIESYDNLVFDDKESAEDSLKVLAAWNEHKDTFQINITGNIIGIRERDNVRLVLSDTPGPNNSQDADHALATMQHIKDSDRNPLILYVLNAQQLGINDDQTLLLQIAEVMKQAGKQNRDRFIFVLNKADVFDPEKGEDIAGVVERAKEYLQNNGIENPMVYPVSARLALLLRQSILNRDLLTRSERNQLGALEELFAEEESMDMVKHMPLNRSVQTALMQQKLTTALYRSGIPAIEAMIDDYINKYNVPHRVTRAYQALNTIIEKSSNEADLKRQLDMDEKALLDLRVEINKLYEQRDKGFGADAYLAKLKKEKRGLSDTQIAILEKAQNKIRAMLKDLENDFDRRGNVSKIDAERILSNVNREVVSEYNCLIVDLDKGMRAAQQEIIADLNQDYQKYVQALFAEVDNLSLPILDNFKSQISGLNGNVFHLSSNDVETVSRRVKDGGHYESTSKWWNQFTWGDKKWVDHYKTEYEEKVHLGKYWYEHSADVRSMFETNINAARKQMEKDGNILLKNFINFMTSQFEPKFNKLINDLQDKLDNRQTREIAIQEGRAQLQRIQLVKDELAELLNI